MVPTNPSSRPSHQVYPSSLHSLLWSTVSSGFFWGYSNSISSAPIFSTSGLSQTRIQNSHSVPNTLIFKTFHPVSNPFSHESSVPGWVFSLWLARHAWFNLTLAPLFVRSRPLGAPRLQAAFSLLQHCQRSDSLLLCTSSLTS